MEGSNSLNNSINNKIEETKENKTEESQINNKNNQDSHVHSHTCNCCHQTHFHTLLNNNIDPNKIKNQQLDKHDYRKEFLKQKLICIPILLSKVLISLYFFETKICYSFPLEEDINYSQKVFPFVALTILIFYLKIIFSNANQTNIKNISLLQKNSEKFSLDCKYCNQKKFIRSSHCKFCNKCILYRDHHCPFVINCVGFSNIQYFINFCLWGFYGLLTYDISCFKFFFGSNFHKNNISTLLSIFIRIDFFFNILLSICLLGLVLRLLVSIYNNRSYLESTRNLTIELKIPCYDFLHNINKDRFKNDWNIGFLQHFYYFMGPSFLHLILPLPKFKNYVFDEECPVFSKNMRVDNLQMYKYYIHVDKGSKKMLIDDSSDPDNYIKLCHQYYDGKIII